MSALLAAGLLGIGLTSGPARAMPERPSHHVSDFAGLLDAALEDELNGALAAIERRTGAEIAVATVSSLEGRTIEDFATRLFNSWAIGKKGVDNGVLLLVARQERKVRIEVGLGLERGLTDAESAKIINEALLPAFRTGDFPGGIRLGTVRIAAIVAPGSWELLSTPERPGKPWLDAFREALKGEFAFLLFGVPSVVIAVGALGFVLAPKTREGRRRRLPALIACAPGLWLFPMTSWGMLRQAAESLPTYAESPTFYFLSAFFFSQLPAYVGLGQLFSLRSRANRRSWAAVRWKLLGASSLCAPAAILLALFFRKGIGPDDALWLMWALLGGVFVLGPFASIALAYPGGRGSGRRSDGRSIKIASSGGGGFRGFGGGRSGGGGASGSW